MSFTINPGQTKTLTAIFTDASGKVEPLGQLPTCVDGSGTLTIAPVGTQTLTDPQFQWTLACPADEVVGTDLPIHVHAEGDAKTGVDPIDGDIDGAVTALEDTQVALSVV